VTTFLQDTGPQTLPAPQPQEPSGGKILVVDDDRLVLATLTHGLTQAGYTVIDADNGDDAILLAREYRPDLALLDIRMEGLSGFDVAAYLRDHGKTPFMFLSAFADDATVRQVRALGAVDYLVKPLDIGRLVSAVQGVFARLRCAPVVPPAEAAVPATALRTPLLPLPEATAMAVGALMQQFAQDRSGAYEQLLRMATAEGRTVAETAERLLDALELHAVKRPQDAVR
jgi:two-component system, response regulator PdtaR